MTLIALSGRNSKENLRDHVPGCLVNAIGEAWAFYRADKIANVAFVGFCALIYQEKI